MFFEEGQHCVQQLRAISASSHEQQERAHIIAIRAIEHIMELRKQDLLLGAFGLPGIFRLICACFVCS